MTKKSASKCVIRNLLFCSLAINILIIFCHFMNKRSTYYHSRNGFFGRGKVIDTNHIFNITKFEYLISKSECSKTGGDSYFVTLISSSPTKFDQRAAIRDTWAHSDPRTVTYFLMGMVQSERLQKRIDQEESQYHDIIQGNFIDAYHNLTYKHTMALKWFSETCPHMKYLLKLDDDVFVNVPAVHEYLANNKKEKKFILGPYREPELVHRNGKWKATREEIVDDFLPEFAEGCSVIYSSDFVQEAFRKTFTTKFLWIDDVYVTGLIRMQLNVGIESIYPLLLGGDPLILILNGTSTELPNSTFLMSDQSLRPQDMRTLWKYAVASPEAQQIESE